MITRVCICCDKILSYEFTLDDKLSHSTDSCTFSKSTQFCKYCFYSISLLKSFLIEDFNKPENILTGFYEPGADDTAIEIFNAVYSFTNKQLLFEFLTNNYNLKNKSNKNT